MAGLTFVAPPDPRPRTPRLKLPAGACDTHVHVFGPTARFPLDPKRPYDVADHPVEELVALHDTVGMSRAVIVHTLLHDANHDYLADATSRHPGRFRVIARPEPTASDATLEALERAGTVGIRVTHRITPRPDERFLARLAERGWHIQFFYSTEEQALDWAALLRRVPGDIVIDHMGGPDPAQGLDGKGFRVTLGMLEAGKAWVKLSGAYRFSKQPALPWSDMTPLLRKFVATAPERLLWGSDWPHPDHHGVMPNDGDLVDLIADWLPDEALRRQVLVDNPARLFRF